MIAAFRDLDVRSVFRCRNDARRKVVIQKCRWLRRQHPQIAVHGFEDALDFACAYHGIYFRHLLQNLLAIALHQAACHNQFLCRAEFLVLRHLQDGLDGFLLRRFDEAARINHQHFRFIGPRRQFVPAARKNAHHHLAVHEVFRTSQTHKSNLGHTQ